MQGRTDGALFDDVHGAGWRLVTTDPDGASLDPATAAWLESIGGHVVVLADPDPTYRRWFADHEVTWALQRPDFYLYGTATGLAGAEHLLGRLRTHVTDRSTLETTGTPA